MTAAEKHVAALVAAFGEPPFRLLDRECACLALTSEGDTVVALVEWAPGRVAEWRIPSPDTLVPDPAGDVVREYPVSDDDGDPVIDAVTGKQQMVEVRLSENPVAVAAQELASFLRVVRA